MHTHSSSARSSVTVVKKIQVGEVFLSSQTSVYDSKRKQSAQRLCNLVSRIGIYLPQNEFFLYNMFLIILLGTSKLINE